MAFRGLGEVPNSRNIISCPIRFTELQRGTRDGSMMNCGEKLFFSRYPTPRRAPSTSSDHITTPPSPFETFSPRDDADAHGACLIRSSPPFASFSHLTPTYPPPPPLEFSCPARLNGGSGVRAVRARDGLRRLYEGQANNYKRHHRPGRRRSNGVLPHCLHGVRGARGEADHRALPGERTCRTRTCS